MRALTPAAALFSTLIHGAVISASVFFAGYVTPPKDRVYHVSLAEFITAPPPVTVDNDEAKGVIAEPTAHVPPLETGPTLPPDEPELKVQSKPEKPHPEKPQQEKPFRKSASESSHKALSPARPDMLQQALSRTPNTIAHGGPGLSGLSGGMSAYAEDAVDERPAISRKVAPQYPENARRRGIQGEVVVQLVVDMEGTPQQCTVHSSSPTGVFDDAALTAARKTRFFPGKINGRPVNTLVLIPYKFTMR